MPSRGPEEDDGEVELSRYPDHSDGANHPLLNGLSSHSERPTYPRRASVSSLRRKHPTLYMTVKRWWKPIAALSAPFILLFLYALLHPHVPGLPPLPTVSIHSGNKYTGPESFSSGGFGGEVPCGCGATEEGERLCRLYHKEGLKSSRLMEGTGARVRRFLHKAREGHPVKVGILGGSVSACHGLHRIGTDEDSPWDPAGPGCYTSHLRNWLAKTFPSAEHNVLNGAIGGMDSSYYAFCGTHHIDTDTDLIILEFDVNDLPDLAYQQFFDQLLRVILEFRSEPAVIILGTWSPQVATDVGYADPQIIHLPNAQFRDVPYISLKQIMYNNFLRFPHSTSTTFFQKDKLHPNARGHRVLADLLISYLETELCRLEHFGMPIVPDVGLTVTTSLDFDDLVNVPFPLDVIPPDSDDIIKSLDKELRHFVLPKSPYDISMVGMFQPLRDVLDPNEPDPKTPAKILGIVQPKTFCADANDQVNPMEPTKSDGWEKLEWKGEKHYWVSSTVGARIRVEIKVNAGRVAVYYFRSRLYDLGDALCWVDDNEKGAVTLPGYWTKEYNTANVAYIDRNVTTGDHFVTCEIARTTSNPTNPHAHHWRLVAVMAT